MDMEVGHYRLMSAPDGEEEVELERRMSEALGQPSVHNAKILAFKEKAPAAKDGLYHRPPITLYT